MVFLKEEQEIVLQRDLALQRSLVSLHSITKTEAVEFCAALFSLNDSREDENNGHALMAQPVVLQNILLKYDAIFDKPQGLLPNRDRNHAIRIKAGCGPVQVRPYRYAHCQKNEKLVA